MPAVVSEAEALAADLQAQRDAVNHALEVTASFDTAVGLTENLKKHQIWCDSEPVEHLGIIAEGDYSVNPSAPVSMPEPRDGWDIIIEVMKRMSWIPGGSYVRQRLYAMSVVPTFTWATPFVLLPTEKFTKRVFEILRNSLCT